MELRLSILFMVIVCLLCQTQSFIWSTTRGHLRQSQVLIPTVISKRGILHTSFYNNHVLFRKKKRKLTLEEWREKHIDPYDRLFPNQEEDNDPELIAIQDELIERYEQLGRYERGDPIRGSIVGHNQRAFFVDLGLNGRGYLPFERAAVSLDFIETIEDFKLEMNQEREFTFVHRMRDGTVMLSLMPQLIDQVWIDIEKLYNDGTVFNSTILSQNIGGGMCDVLGMCGFLPGSHSLQPNGTYVPGTKLQLKVITLDKESGKIVVSERLASYANAKPLQRGDVVTGTIAAIRNYGCFISLPTGKSGLLHISRISKQPLGNTTELNTIFKVGQMVKVMVMETDSGQSNDKISLSMRALEYTPGEILQNMTKVFEEADERGEAYRKRKAAERLAREQNTQKILTNLDEIIAGNDSPSSGVDDMKDSSFARTAAAGGSKRIMAQAVDSIESILASINTSIGEGDESDDTANDIDQLTSEDSGLFTGMNPATTADDEIMANDVGKENLKMKAKAVDSLAEDTTDEDQLISSIVDSISEQGP